MLDWEDAESVELVGNPLECNCRWGDCHYVVTSICALMEDYINV